MLEGKRVADAVLRSTERYLSFLTDQGRGVERHAVTSIRASEEGQQLLEGALWYTYLCELPPGLRLRPDSAATLSPDNSVTSDVEIRILRYDRRTGEAEVAARENVAFTSGLIAVDFRWLVRRCLDWYREHGSSLCSLAELKPPNPPSVQLAPGSGLSEEQEKAITVALSSPLTYIWGPPGTGKTKWVLAKAVALCVSSGEKALILAPTNNAVDNALSAIIVEGVASRDVLRIGAPSQRFLTKFPECCEEQAFRSEIAQISSQIQSLQRRIASIQRREELQGEIRELQVSLDEATRELAETQKGPAELEHKLAENQRVLEEQKELLTPHEQELEAKRRKLEGLGVLEIQEDIEALEREQTDIIRARSDEQKALERLGFLSRVFTKREMKLRGRIEDLAAHLRATESTLESRRKQLARVEPTSKALQEEICEIEALCEPEWERRSELQDLVTDVEAQLVPLRAKLTEAEKRRNSVESRIRLSEGELLQLAIDGTESEDTEEGTREELERQKASLSAQLAKYKQDMASKSVLGMTLDGFVGITMQLGLAADRIFVDEAPFAPLAKAIPLLSLRRPVTLLGDHLQLPPVCECGNDDAIRAYWAKPSVFLEDAFISGEDYQLLHGLDEPRFNLIQKQVLRTSYRFGPSVASLLDMHIYGGIGLRGVAESETFIECRDCKAREVKGRRKRENHAEAEAIIAEIEGRLNLVRNTDDVASLAVLTPYKHQARLIRKLLKQQIDDPDVLYLVEVLNTHQAQGREWDSVLFSVADTGRLKRNDPWFTDSTRSDARALLNTTISRTKKHLIVFLDFQYWSALPQKSLLRDIAQTSRSSPALTHQGRAVGYISRQSHRDMTKPTNRTQA